MASRNDSDNFEGIVSAPLVPIREYVRDVRFLLAAVHGPQRSGTMICARSHGSVSLSRGEQADGPPCRGRNRGRPRCGVSDVRLFSCVRPPSDLAQLV